MPDNTSPRYKQKNPFLGRERVSIIKNPAPAESGFFDRIISTGGLKGI
jgi:hypothetical protein